MPKTEPNSQLIVALAIVIVLGIVALGLIGAAVYLAYVGKTESAIWTAIGAAVGSLATALNAPTGVTSALRAATTNKDPAP